MHICLVACMHSPCVPNPSCTRHRTARQKCLQVSQYPALTCLDTVCSVSTAASSQTNYGTPQQESRGTHTRTQRAVNRPLRTHHCAPVKLCCTLPCNAMLNRLLLALHTTLVSHHLHASQPTPRPKRVHPGTPRPTLVQTCTIPCTQTSQACSQTQKREKLPVGLVPTGRGVGTLRPQEHTSQLHTLSDTPSPCSAYTTPQHIHFTPA